MTALVVLLPIIPLVLAIWIIVGLVIGRIASKPDESRIRRSVDAALRKNGVASPSGRVVVAILLLALAALLFFLLSTDSSWAGLGGSWLGGTG